MAAISWMHPCTRSASSGVIIWHLGENSLLAIFSYTKQFAKVRCSPLVLTLQKADYKVLQARDGREGINQLQKNPNIQLVISDVEMPNMNGFEFLSHRRTDPQISKIPVVMLTSRSSEKHRQLAMHLGAKHYFTKPYIEQEFLAAIKNILSQNASAAQVLSLSH